MLTKPEILKARARGEIEVTPWNPKRLNPNSYNLRLAGDLRFYEPEWVLDARTPFEPGPAPLVGGSWILRPGCLYLGVTVEYTRTKHYIPMINGRSSLARLGVSVHQTGGFGDIGFCGHWTLELAVVVPVRLYPEMKIAQICWFEPSSIPPACDLYAGKYPNEEPVPVASRIHKEFRR